MATERQQQRLSDLCCRLCLGTDDAPTLALDRWLMARGLSPVRWLPTPVARELVVMVEGWLCVIGEAEHGQRRLSRGGDDGA